MSESNPETELLASPELQNYLLALLTLHLVCYIAVKAFSSNELARQPHVAAHFPVSLVAFAVLAMLGTHTWLYDDQLATLDRLHGTSAKAITISRFMVAFQYYELFAIVCDRSLAGPGGIMALHHAVVIVLGSLVVTQQYMHYYAIFFFGVPELSSLPLTLVDLFKSFKHLRDANDMLNGVVRNLFALIFIPVRVFWFPLVSLEFWKDSLTEAQDPNSRHNPVMVLGVCGANIFMTALQLYWGSLIVRAIVKILTGDATHKDA